MKQGHMTCAHVYHNITCEQDRCVYVCVERGRERERVVTWFVFHITCEQGDVCVCVCGERERERESRHLVCVPYYM